MTHLWSQCESHFADILLGSAVKVGKILVNASAVFITVQLSVRPGLLSESLMYTPRKPHRVSLQLSMKLGITYLLFSYKYW